MKEQINVKKDFRGKTLKIGDKIVAVYGTIGTPNLITGTVSGFTDKRVKYIDEHKRECIKESRLIIKL